MDAYQLIEGKLQEVTENPIEHAKNIYEIRKSIDTGPKIVQMVLFGRPISHWYYRSEEWIDQPYLKTTECLHPYVGKAQESNPLRYGEGTYLEIEDRVLEDLLRYIY